MTFSNLRAGLLAGTTLSLATAVHSQTLELIAGAGRYVDAPGTTVPVAPSNRPFLGFGPDGRLYIVDYNSHFLRFDPVTGTATALPANDSSVNFRFSSTNGLAFDPNGNLYVSAEGLLRILDPSSGAMTTLPGFFPPGNKMVFGADGTLYSVADSRVYARHPSGSYAVIAGTGVWGFSGDNGPAINAQLDSASSIAIGPEGDVYVADLYNNRIRRISRQTGIITTVVGTGVRDYNGDGLAATATNLDLPRSLAFDAGGNLYIGTYTRIRRVDAATGIVTTVAGGSTYGNFGNGGSALTATLAWPSALEIDAAGNLYFDSESFEPGNGSRHIRRVDAATGIITHVLGGPDSWFCGAPVPARASCFIQPSGLDIDENQNVYVSNFGTRRLFRYSPQSGLVSVVAHTGNLTLEGMEHDSAGQIYAATWGGYQISRVDPSTGVVTRVAGTGSYGFGGDGGPALNASFASPGDVEVDAAGNLFIADGGNGRIRRVDAQTQVVTTYATLSNPGSVEFDAAGHLIVSGGYCGLRRIDSVTRAISTIVGTGTCASTAPAGGTLATATPIGSAPEFDWDADGNLYLMWNAGILYRVDAATGILDRVTQPPTGLQTADGVRITEPRRMEFDATGTLYVVDSRGYLFRISGLASDRTAPEITPSIGGSLGDNGWYTTNVNVSWTVSDPESAVSNSSGCGASTVTEDTAGTTFTCSATSRGGTTSNSVTIRRDGSVPLVIFGIPLPGPAAPGSGWYNADQSVPFTAEDPVSGVASVSIPSPVLITGEGAGLMHPVVVANNAGMSVGLFTPPINIDRTPPAVSIAVPAAAATYGAFSTTAANYSCSDLLSGISTCAGTLANGAALPTSTSGAKSFTVDATDLAGNVATIGRSYTVAPLVFERFIEPLRRSPTFNGVTAGSLVPIRWRLLSANQAVTNPAAFQSLQVFNLGCSGSTVPLVDPAVGGAGLTVNPANGYFIYNWQTDPSWAGTCKRVQVRFSDNTFKEVVFRF